MFNRKNSIFCLLTIFACCSPIRADISPGSIEQRLLSGGSLPISTNADSVASVRLKNSQGTVHICGGFIINKHWVGTAAQCLTGKTINNTVVAVGRPTVTGGPIYDINQIEKHNYNVNWRRIETVFAASWISFQLHCCSRSWRWQTMLVYWEHCKK